MINPHHPMRLCLKQISPTNPGWELRAWVPDPTAPLEKKVVALMGLPIELWDVPGAYPELRDIDTLIKENDSFPMSLTSVAPLYENGGTQIKRDIARWVAGAIPQLALILRAETGVIA